MYSIAAAVVTAAGAQAATDQTNRVVRIRISHGATHFGDIDVELFDSDKPVTVSNFLAYVKSGAYRNVLLHRLEPGFVLQGGDGGIANPYSSSPFEFLTEVPKGAPIINEFSVGTKRSNTYGTLAMSRLPGDPNSATTSWFFNLGDNSTNFDYANGGLTVFGQVKSGFNVLDAFNTTFSSNLGIIDTLVYKEGFGCSQTYILPGAAATRYEELPVSYYQQRCPTYKDLFVAQILMVNVPDAERPNAAITAPQNNAIVTNELVTISGKASDNVGVAEVQVYLGNTNAPVVVAGTNFWSVALTNVPPGTNVVTMVAADASGNTSLPVKRSFFRSVRAPLSLHIVGNGTVIGASNDDMLELTRYYRITASPSPDYLFAGWTGTRNSSSTTIWLRMEPNASLTALFVPNPFPAVKGTYYGLFSNTNKTRLDNSGFFTLTVGDKGTYTGKLQANGKSHRFSGTFALDGKANNYVSQYNELNPFLLSMNLDLNGGSDELTGLVSRYGLSEDGHSYTNHTAALRADRLLLGSRIQPRPFAGKYTMTIPVGHHSQLAPAGDGCGTVTVDAIGWVRLNVILANGNRAVQKAPLSRNGLWPLFVSYNGGKGALLSWVNFDTNQFRTDFSGAMTWLDENGYYEPYWFTNQGTIIGSRYNPPTTNRVIQMVNGIVGFTNDGWLAVGFAHNVTLGANNKVINLSSNKMTLTIHKETGLFTGVVTQPGLVSPMRFIGAVLQKQNTGSGFFSLVGSQPLQSGRVSISP